MSLTRIGVHGRRLRRVGCIGICETSACKTGTPSLLANRAYF
jgi:hypothetical protein